MNSDIDFNDLRFEDFQKLAKRSDLSVHEKVGFPDDYRNNKELEIFRDIQNKVEILLEPNKNILEIGPGCGPLPKLLIDCARDNGHKVTFVDCAEMLNHLKDEDFVQKVEGRFPEALQHQPELRQQKFDAIIAYSVVQYVFASGDVIGCLDACLSLLAPGGILLFGDLPNASMRKRFLASDAGRKFHENYHGEGVRPEIAYNTLNPGVLDDSVIISMILRARGQGFHAWVVPQGELLPMSNRREDLVVKRP